MPAGNKPTRRETDRLVGDGVGFDVCCWPVRTRRTALVLLTATAFMCTLAKEGVNGTLSQCLTKITHSMGSHDSERYLVGLGQLGYAIGKATSVWAVFRFGGHRVLGVSIAVMGLAALLFAALGPSSFVLMSLFWWVSQFSASHAWTAGMRLISNWIDERAQGRFLGLVIGTSGNLGGAVYAESYGQILQALEPNDALAYQAVYVLAGAVALVTGVLALLVTRLTPMECGFDPPKRIVDVERARSGRRRRRGRQRGCSPACAPRSRGAAPARPSARDRVRTR